MAEHEHEGAVELVREVLHDDAERLHRARKVLGRGLAAATLAAHMLATLVLSLIVFANPFPYPLMSILMGLVLWLVLAIRLASDMGRRPWMNGFMVLFNLVLNGFWMAVLVDQMPGRLVVKHDETMWRGDMPLLWLPVLLFALACVGLVVRWVLSVRHRPVRT